MKSKNKKASYVNKIRLFMVFIGIFALTIASMKTSQANTYKLPIFNGGDWVKYFSKPGFVEIYFPVQYENKFQETTDGKVTTVTATSGETKYMLIWTILKDNAATDFAASKAAMTKFKDSYNGQVKEEDKFKMKKCEGVEALILIPEKNLTLNYKVIIVNKIMYQIAVISPTASIDKKNVNKFMKSFEITN